MSIAEEAGIFIDKEEYINMMNSCVFTYINSASTEVLVWLVMRKTNKKNLNKILRKARQNNFKNENKKPVSITSSVLNNLDEEVVKDFEKKINWKHKPGDIGYLTKNYRSFEKDDIVLVIRESSVQNPNSFHNYKENYFHALISGSVILVPGSFIRIF